MESRKWCHLFSNYDTVFEMKTRIMFVKIIIIICDNYYHRFHAVTIVISNQSFATFVCFGFLGRLFSFCIYIVIVKVLLAF